MNAPDISPQPRRQFLKQLGLASAGILTASPLGPLRAQDGQGLPMPVQRRKFGRHDLTVSSMALGGHALRLASDEEAFRMVDEALDLGVNFFDNAWDYHGGKSEELMGRALEGKRDKVFLMTKLCTHENGDKEAAMKMLEESLKRLRTDHLDLWQLHAVATMNQVERAFAPNGAIEALELARQQGKVRFIGFTGHTDPEVHLAMLSRGYPFDSCQLPISAIEANSNAFVRRVLPELVKQQIAPLGMKSLSANANPIKDGVLSVPEALMYSLSQPIVTLVSGITSVAQLRQNARIAAAFEPMPREQQLALEVRCRPATESNQYQPYRKWMTYRDGDAASAASRYV